MRSHLLKSAAAVLLASAALVACMPVAQDATPASVSAERNVEAEINAIMARMTTEQKVAQLIQPDISTITPDDVRTYRFGTILNGGNSGPYGNEKAPASDWLKLADEFWEASMAPHADGSPAIPVLWATDAVHGHSNVVGATVFPHNVGLGATRNPALIEQIGAATAAEIAATGIDWTFAPTLAVIRDDRWGRTYESYGEDPVLVGELGAAMVHGLQGRPGSADYLGQNRVIATAKHFFGDGGTGGVDQGNTKGDVAEIRQIHLTPYTPALGAGAETVMASFSSINGEKMHGSQYWLTDVLRGEMNFKGLVVGDWNGHGQIPGCTNTRCPQAINAGLDIFMVPEDWKALLTNTVADVESGVIPMSRLDEAVRRVLRLKFAYGAFDKPKPSERANALPKGGIGTMDHRALARDAVRQSLVLLKNDGVLPIKPNAHILVTGAGADNIPQQSGGWTISWQGGADLTNADFPGATSIYAGFQAAARDAGGSTELSADGSFNKKPDVAVVVFGEKPYAEFVGDMPNLDYADESGLATMRALKAQGIKVVAVFLSGRPMWMNPEINAADAFVAAWLPGSEGAGVADVLMAGKDGKARFEFTGRLSMSWPKTCDQFDLNKGQSSYAPLFAYGFGLSYAAATAPTGVAAPLDETCALSAMDGGDHVPLIKAGVAVHPVVLSLVDDRAAAVVASRQQSPNGRLVMTPVDRNAQEDARRFVFGGPAAIAWTLPASTLTNRMPTRLTMDVQVNMKPRDGGGAILRISCGAGCSHSIDITEELKLAEGKGWRQINVDLSKLGLPSGSSADWTISLTADKTLSIDISTVRLY